MKKIFLSPFLGIALLSFAAAIIFSFYPHNIFQKQYITLRKSVHGAYVSKLAATQTPTPTYTIYNNTQLTLTPTISPSITQPTPTITAQNQAQPTSQPTTAPTVILQIAEPDGATTFSLPVIGTVCDELTEAKNEGKIRSVTFSSTYMNSMHSLYITEINGYQNNWTFTVNGTAPQGCSLVTPKSGDSIVWKFN